MTFTIRQHSRSAHVKVEDTSKSKAREIWFIERRRKEPSIPVIYMVILKIAATDNKKERKKNRPQSYHIRSNQEIS